MLVSYYSKSNEILWVEHQFIKESVRVQRKQHFTHKLLENTTIEVISSSLENCFVNGLPNKSISSKIIPNRIEHSLEMKFQKVPNNDLYQFVKLELDNFIGNNTK